MTELQKNNIVLIDYANIVNLANLDLIALRAHQEMTLKDVKRYIYHFLTRALCDAIINCTDGKPIIIVRSGIGELFRGILDKLCKLLPIRVYREEFHCCEGGSDFDLGDIEIDYLDMNKLINCQPQCKTYSFEKIKKFADKNGLTFLSEEYFNQLRTKQLLFR